MSESFSHSSPQSINTVEDVVSNVDICYTCVGTKKAPTLPLREELQSLGVELVYDAKGTGWSSAKSSQKKKRKEIEFISKEVSEMKQLRSPINRVLHKLTDKDKSYKKKKQELKNLSDKSYQCEALSYDQYVSQMSQTPSSAKENKNINAIENGNSRQIPKSSDLSLVQIKDRQKCDRERKVSFAENSFNQCMIRKPNENNIEQDEKRQDTNSIYNSGEKIARILFPSRENLAEFFFPQKTDNSPSLLTHHEQKTNLMNLDQSEGLTTSSKLKSEQEKYSDSIAFSSALSTTPNQKNSDEKTTSSTQCIEQKETSHCISSMNSLYESPNEQIETLLEPDNDIECSSSNSLVGLHISENNHDLSEGNVTNENGNFVHHRGISTGIIKKERLYTKEKSRTMVVFSPKQHKTQLVSPEPVHEDEIGEDSVSQFKDYTIGDKDIETDKDEFVVSASSSNSISPSTVEKKFEAILEKDNVDFNSWGDSTTEQHITYLEENPSRIIQKYKKDGNKQESTLLVKSISADTNLFAQTFSTISNDFLDEPVESFTLPLEAPSESTPKQETDLPRSKRSVLNRSQYDSYRHYSDLNDTEKNNDFIYNNIKNDQKDRKENLDNSFIIKQVDDSNHDTSNVCINYHKNSMDQALNKMSEYDVSMLKRALVNNQGSYNIPCTQRIRSPFNGNVMDKKRSDLQKASSSSIDKKDLIIDKTNCKNEQTFIGRPGKEESEMDLDPQCSNMKNTMKKSPNKSSNALLDTITDYSNWMNKNLSSSSSDSPHHIVSSGLLKKQVQSDSKPKTTGNRIVSGSEEMWESRTERNVQGNDTRVQERENVETTSTMEFMRVEGSRNDDALEGKCHYGKCSIEIKENQTSRSSERVSTPQKSDLENISNDSESIEKTIATESTQKTSNHLSDAIHAFEKVASMNIPETESRRTDQCMKEGILNGQEYKHQTEMTHNPNSPSKVNKTNQKAALNDTIAFFEKIAKNVTRIKQTKTINNKTPKKGLIACTSDGRGSDSKNSRLKKKNSESKQNDDNSCTVEPKVLDTKLGAKRVNYQGKEKKEVPLMNGVSSKSRVSKISINCNDCSDQSRITEKKNGKLNENRHEYCIVESKKSDQKKYESTTSKCVEHTQNKYESYIHDKCGRQHAKETKSYKNISDLALPQALNQFGQSSDECKFSNSISTNFYQQGSSAKDRKNISVKSSLPTFSDNSDGEHAKEIECNGSISNLVLPEAPDQVSQSNKAGIQNYRNDASKTMDVTKDELSQNGSISTIYHECKLSNRISKDQRQPQSSINTCRDSTMKRMTNIDNTKSDLPTISDEGGRRDTGLSPPVIEILSKQRINHQLTSESVTKDRDPSCTYNKLKRYTSKSGNENKVVKGINSDSCPENMIKIESNETTYTQFNKSPTKKEVEDYLKYAETFDSDQVSSIDDEFKRNMSQHITVTTDYNDLSKDSNAALESVHSKGSNTCATEVGDPADLQTKIKSEGKVKSYSKNDNIVIQTEITLPKSALRNLYGDHDKQMIFKNQVNTNSFTAIHGQRRNENFRSLGKINYAEEALPSSQLGLDLNFSFHEEDSLEHFLNIQHLLEEEMDNILTDIVVLCDKIEKKSENLLSFLPT